MDDAVPAAQGHRFIPQDPNAPRSQGIADFPVQSVIATNS